MPERASLAWVFFSLSGRLSPAAFVLAGLLVFVAKGYLLYTAPAGFLYQFSGAEPASADLWATPAAERWLSLFSVFSLAELWFYFALTAKRMHDFGRPTILALIAVPLGSLLLLVLPFFKGDPGPNRYGEHTDAPQGAAPE